MTRGTNLDRRTFLRNGGLALGAGVTMAGPFQALAARAAGAESRAGSRPSTSADYGPLYPTKDQTTGQALIALPRGFEYLTFGRTGDPMSDGVLTPGAHDGMAAFRDGDLVRLVRNHERGDGLPFGGPVYDPASAGGTTTLTFHPDRGELVEAYSSLSGTIRNCAGGPTPAGTWLTCEETTQINGTGDGQVRHGYVFEVPATGVSTAIPIRGMGRFSHEATATDPVTGIVYETEDAGSSALYRYVPKDAADLAAGGTLEAMKLEGTPDTKPWVTGSTAKATWVTVDQPDPGRGEPSCWQQASAKGAARIVRGEGAWYGNGVIYVVSTSGGPEGHGQVFAYDPAAATFTCVYASLSAVDLQAPDNICVSPRGGLVLCEDGSGTEYMHGLTPDGEIFRFAENLLNGSEWAGATFEPKNGSWLFANLQSPGITFAITGPWRQGAL